jgi:hypothetical protein
MQQLRYIVDNTIDLWIDEKEQSRMSMHFRRFLSLLLVLVLTLGMALPVYATEEGAAEGLTVSAENVDQTYDGNAYGVTAVSSIEGATIRYSTDDDSTYTLEKSPTITDVGYLMVYFQASYEGYADAYGSAMVVINPKPVTIAVLNGAKYYGHDDPFFSYVVGDDENGTELNLNGINLAVTRSDATDNEVGLHEEVLCISATEEELAEAYPNYRFNIIPGDFEIKENTFDLTVSAENVVRTYDGNAYGVTAVPSIEGATIRYSTDGIEHMLLESPTATNVTENPLIVYFRATLPGYTPSLGSATVTILPAPNTDPVETIEPLAAPEVTSVKDGDTLAETAHVLRYSEVPGVSYYIISLRDRTISETEDIGLVWNHKSVGKATYADLPALTPGHSYRVAVGAVPEGITDTTTDEAKKLIGWDEVEFTVAAEVAAEKLDPPTITSVDGGDELPTASHTLKWTEVEGADRYIISLRDRTISETEDKGLVWEHKSVGKVTYADLPALTPGHSYRVAVGAVPEGISDTFSDEADKVMGWDTVEFTVAATAGQLAAPVITAPTGDDPLPNTTTQTTLTWKAVVGAEDGYLVSLTDLTTPDDLLEEEPEDGLSFVLGDLEQGHSYRAKVGAVPADETTAIIWSTVDFSVAPADGALANPKITYPKPTDSFVYTTTFTEVEWEPVANANEYRVTLYDLTADEVVSPFYQYSVEKTTYLKMPAEYVPGHLYRVTVYAVPPYGAGEDVTDLMGQSSVDFSVNLAKPAISAPAPGQMLANTATSVDFIWGEVDDADHYVIRMRDITTDDEEGPLVIDYTRVDGLSTTLKGLEVGKQYRAAVGSVPEGAADDSNQVEWETVTFSVSATAIELGAPVIIDPDDDDPIYADGNAKISWNEVQNGGTYFVEIDNVTDEQDIAYADSTTGLSITMQLAPDKQYRVRVGVVPAGGAKEAASWSADRVFYVKDTSMARAGAWITDEQGWIDRYDTPNLNDRVPGGYVDFHDDFEVLSGCNGFYEIVGWSTDNPNMITWVPSGAVGDVMNDMCEQGRHLFKKNRSYVDEAHDAVDLHTLYQICDYYGIDCQYEEAGRSGYTILSGANPCAECLAAEAAEQEALPCVEHQWVNGVCEKCGDSCMHMLFVSSWIYSEHPAHRAQCRECGEYVLDKIAKAECDLCCTHFRKNVRLSPDKHPHTNWWQCLDCGYEFGRLDGSSHEDCLDCQMREKYLDTLNGEWSAANPLEDNEIGALFLDRLEESLDENMASRVYETIKKAPSLYRDLAVYSLMNYSIQSTDWRGGDELYGQTIENDAFFYGTDRGIYFDEENVSDRTLYHEMGHAVDFSLELLDDYTATKNLSRIVQDDVAYALYWSVEKYVRNLPVELLPGGLYESRDDMIKRIRDSFIDPTLVSDLLMFEREIRGLVIGDYNNKLTPFDDYVFDGAKEYHRGVSDVYGGVTHNAIGGYAEEGGAGLNIGTRWGHSNDYWQQSEHNTGKELWAHFFSAQMRNDTEELEFMREMFPNAYAYMEGIAEEMLDTYLDTYVEALYIDPMFDLPEGVVLGAVDTPFAHWSDCIAV